jgi:acetylornithine deacetylase/succinyl-diaminopimelate desuccinylase-like protein
MIGASDALNVIPAHAELRLDCRVLPGAQPDELLGEVRACLGDLDVELELAEPPEGGTRSPIDTPLAGMLREYVETIEPGALVLPSMSAGFTNSHFLREAFGTVAYGFFPSRAMPAETSARLIHSADERVPVEDLELGVRWLLHAARSVCA